MSNLKFEDLKFMSIGGNCADLGFLGKDRIRGPVDNMAGVKNSLCFKSLFDGTFLNEFDSDPVQSPRYKGYEGDSAICYTYKSYSVCHNNPFEEKFKTELIKRYNNFKEFYNNITKPEYYFTYSINTEVSKYSNVVQNPKLIRDEINFLKNLGILNKTIFVGTRLVNIKNNWNYYAKNFQKDYPEILYIEMIDLNVFDTVNSQKQFREKVIKLLNLTE